ncbi:MAG TPA: aminotransferase class III-fold pyridoxal phosphate-dependent enzyme, partial [Candidatus Eisenbacteria bacterium]|nr:aminotransferase class III-fold pyridoxal phosphate-dependent enzyme [Candidatus Eisenbacteria bacterium]
MSHLLKPQLGETLPTVARARGSWVWDTAGRLYLDGSSGAVVVSLGHAHPEVLRALREQSELVTYAVRGQFTSEPAERLATRLAELAPGDLDSVFLVNSGSEAVEATIKLALQHWSDRGRPEKRWFVSRRGSYHGTTLGALSLSGHPVRRRRFEPLLHPFPAVPQPSQYRCAASAACPPCDLSCADAFDSAIRTVGADLVAGVVVEPVVGATGGAVVAPPGYHQRLREISDRHDVLLIADEVMTGVGR